jgi:hypothetical protein
MLQVSSDPTSRIPNTEPATPTSFEATRRKTVSRPVANWNVIEITRPKKSTGDCKEGLNCGWKRNRSFDSLHFFGGMHVFSDLE